MPYRSSAAQGLLGHGCQRPCPGMAGSPSSPAGRWSVRWTRPRTPPSGRRSPTSVATPSDPSSTPDPQPYLITAPTTPIRTIARNWVRGKGKKFSPSPDMLTARQPSSGLAMAGLTFISSSCNKLNFHPFFPPCFFDSHHTPIRPRLLTTESARVSGIPCAHTGTSLCDSSTPFPQCRQTNNPFPKNSESKPAFLQCKGGLFGGRIHTSISKSTLFFSPRIFTLFKII